MKSDDEMGAPLIQALMLLACGGQYLLAIGLIWGILLIIAPVYTDEEAAVVVLIQVANDSTV